ncbi:MAG: SDR family oxidoreductase [Gammaproteobacteria bacterium]
MELKDVPAIVTGGGTGIGAAVAQSLVEAGAKVTILGRRREVIEATARRIGALGLSCDVSQTASVDGAIETARKAHGPARILVNSANAVGLVPTLEKDGTPTPPEPFLEALHTTLFGTFYVTQRAAASLIRHSPQPDAVGGVVVNLSSIAAADSAPGSSGYVAAKAGIDALTLSLARDFGRWRIRVVTLSVGTVETETEQRLPPPVQKFLLSLIPARDRIGNPQEVADLVLHVCRNELLNGCVIRCDAGARIAFTRRI